MASSTQVMFTDPSGLRSMTKKGAGFSLDPEEDGARNGVDRLLVTEVVVDVAVVVVVLVVVVVEVVLVLVEARKGQQHQRLID